MTSSCITTLFGTVGLVGTMAFAAVDLEKPQPQPISGKIEWVFDYEEGQRLSRASGKPMFVVFRCER